MSDIADKLSSYNIFNYLLPGTLFAGIGSRFTSYSFIEDNLLIAPFVYYFIGLIISRVGSLLIEPPLRKWGFLKFADYSEFVEACHRDKTLAQLSEANNMYRTLVSLFIFLIGLILFEALANSFPIVLTISPYVAVALLFFLFLLSYKKQSNYISRRVAANKPDKEP